MPCLDHYHVVLVVVGSSCDETQIVTPTKIKEAPRAVLGRFGIGSPRTELVTKENKSAMALQIGTAVLMSDLARRK